MRRREMKAALLFFVDIPPMADGKGDDYELIVFDNTNEAIISYPVSPLSAAISS